MSDLRDLYQDIILDHYKKPRNFGELSDASGKADGFNPLCGDKLTVYLKVDGDIVQDVRFEGSGCAISTASASIMTDALKGKTRKEAEALFEVFHRMITGQGDVPDTDELGKLAVFSGVRDYPVRVKCATLAWHTLKAALEDKGEPVTTE